MTRSSRAKAFLITGVTQGTYGTTAIISVSGTQQVQYSAPANAAEEGYEGQLHPHDQRRSRRDRDGD